MEYEQDGISKVPL